MQTRYLPQVLACLVQPLAADSEALSLEELTHALKTCFKVLSKVQMPPSFTDAEPASGDGVGAGSGRGGSLSYKGLLPPRERRAVRAG